MRKMLYFSLADWPLYEIYSKSLYTQTNHGDRKP